MKVSKNHREKLLKLQDCAKVKRINGVKVCFQMEFRIGREVFIGLAEDGRGKAVKRILNPVLRPVLSPVQVVAKL